MTHLSSLSFKAARLLPMAAVALALGSAAAPTGSRYHNAAQGYSLTYPSNWKQAPAGAPGVPATGTAFFAPRVGKFTPNLNIVTEDAHGLNTEQYAAANKRGIAARVPNAKISGDRATTLGGTPARTWQMRLPFPNGLVVQNRQIFCVHNGTGYVMTMTATPSTLAKYEPVLDRIRASFKWDK